MEGGGFGHVAATLSGTTRINQIYKQHKLKLLIAVGLIIWVFRNCWEPGVSVPQAKPKYRVVESTIPAFSIWSTVTC